MGLIKNLDSYSDLPPEDCEEQSVFSLDLEDKSTLINAKNTIEENAIKSVIKDSHLLKEILSDARGELIDSKLNINSDIKNQDEKTGDFLLKIGERIKYDEESYHALIKMLRKQAKKEFSKSTIQGSYSNAEKKQIISNIANYRLELLLRGIDFQDFKDESNEIGRILKELSQVCFETPKNGGAKQLKKVDLELSEVVISQKKYRINISAAEKSVKFSPLDKEKGDIICVKYFKKNNSLLHYDEIQQFKKAIKKAVLQVIFDNKEKGNQRDVRRETSKSLHKAIEFMFGGTTQGVETIGEIVANIEPAHTILDGTNTLVEEFQKLADQTVKRQSTLDPHEASHSISQAERALGATSAAIGGIQVLEGAIKAGRGVHSYSDAQVYLKTYNDLKRRIASGAPVNVKELDIKALDAIEKDIRIKLLLDLTLGGSRIISGGINILEGAAIISGATVIAAAGMGTGGGLLITGGGIHALYNSYKWMKIDDRMYEARNISKELHTENVSIHDLEIAEKFVEMEVKLLKNKKRQIQVSLASDAVLAVGGCLLVAAAVSGAGSYGIGAGVVLGAGAFVLLGFEGYELWKKYEFKKLQKNLKNEDARKINESIEKGTDVNVDFSHMKSISGIVIELSRRVKKEQEAKALNKDSPTPLSNHIVVQYMRMEPETFIKMMDGVLDVFLNEGRVDQILQLDTPKLEITATLRMPRSL